MSSCAVNEILPPQTDRSRRHRRSEGENPPLAQAARHVCPKRFDIRRRTCAVCQKKRLFRRACGHWPIHPRDKLGDATEVAPLRGEVGAAGPRDVGAAVPREVWAAGAADSLYVKSFINFSPLAGETFLNLRRRKPPQPQAASAAATSGGVSRRNLKRRQPPQPQAASAAGNLRRRKPPETSGGVSRHETSGGAAAA